MKLAGNISMLLLAVVLGSCTVTENKSTEEKKTSVRKVGMFEKIEMDAACSVVYTQGDATQVKVVGSKEALDQLETVVENNTLKLRHRLGKRLFGINRNVDATVYVTTPDLTMVSIKGSGDFCSESRIDSDNFGLQLFGSGDVDIKDIICDDFAVELKGAGNVKVGKLQCTSSKLSIYGTGDMNVHHYKVARCRLMIYGVGNMEASFDQCGKVSSHIFGTGNIELRGDVRSLERQIKGVGDIDADGLRVKGENVVLKKG